MDTTSERRNAHKLNQSRRNFLKSTLAFMAAASFTGNESVSAREEKQTKDALNIIIYLYDRITALDAIGPYEVLRFMNGAKIRFVGKKAGMITLDSGIQMLNAGYGISDVNSADILLVPGGDAGPQTKDQQVLDWIRSLHEKTRWTVSTSTGSLILGAAGLLKGVQATSYWNTVEDLTLFGAKPIRKRYVRQGKIITGAGVSAGIDTALAVVALEQGEEMSKLIQLLIEYDPQPPFHAGSASIASPPMIRKARKLLNDLYSPVPAEVPSKP